MIQFITNIVVGVLLFWLTGLLADTFVPRKPKSLWLLILTSIIFSFTIGLINQPNILLMNIVGVIFLHSIFVFLFFSIKWYYALLLALLQWGITAFSETTFMLFMAASQNRPLQEDYITQDIFMIIGQTFGIFLSLAVILVIRLFVKKRKRQMNLPQNLAVILFPLTSVVVCIYVIVTVVDILSKNQVFQLGIALCIIMVVVNIAALIGNEHVRSRYALQTEIEAMKYQEDLVVGLMHQQEEHLKETKAQAHDFKNHLHCLQALIKDKDKDHDPSLKYIDDLLQNVDSTDMYIDVKNEALRAILCSTNGTCKEHNIDFTCQLNYSEFSFMSYADISILFTNAINNAVDACKQGQGESRRYIDVKVLRQNGMLFLQFTNSKSGEVKMQDGILLSTKPHPEHHGIGFKNMERVALKYGGEITIDYDETEFRLFINLPSELEEDQKNE